MITRTVVMTGVLGAAVGGPYLVSEGPKHLEGMSWPGAATTAPQSADALMPMAPIAITPPTVTPLDGPGAMVYQSPAPIEGLGFVSLNELLRMDINKEWVYMRWARKTTGLADPELFGVRAPVVTGTAMADLAGSVSYYFNAEGRVDRLRFYGSTADTSAVIQIAAQRFGMTPRPAPPGEQLLQNGDGDRVVCELRTRPAPVLWATSPHSSFQVELEVNRPGTDRYVATKQLVPELPPTADAAPRESARVAEAPQPTEPATPQAAEATETAPPEQPPLRWLEDANRPAYRWPN
ncbi:MAG: DUF6690 family protein [Planctomycetota bacterium]